MSLHSSLRHRQKAELYQEVRYLDDCDMGVIPASEINPERYRVAAKLCRQRLEEVASPEYYSDLLRHSDAFNVIVRNMQYERMLMDYRAEFYPELDDVMSRLEKF